jgi:hypothetical protein
MSVTPGRAPEQEARPPVARKWGWQGRLLAICFAILAFEIGLFLVIFPWMNSWNLNYLKVLSPTVTTIWEHPYFRGGLSGLGLVNIYVAFREVTRLKRGV